MDVAGNVLWNKTFGGNKDDMSASIIATRDGGFLVGGTSNSDSTGSKTDSSFWHSNDYWVVKLDADGNKVWDQTIGGVFNDVMTSLTELPLGGYVLGGYSYSDASGSKRTNNLGAENNADYWIAILNGNGDMMAQSVFGGGSHDVLTSVLPAAQGGVLTAGYSYSIKLQGHKVQATVGNCDYWLVRSDDTGKMVYQGNFGGDRSDFLTTMETYRDSTFVIGGYSNSSASFDKTGDFLGTTDYWFLKVGADDTKQWDKVFGGTGGDYMTSLQRTHDGGYILGGYSNSNKGNDKTEDSRGGYDYWIIKTDSLGNKIWDKTIGGSGDEKLCGVYEIDSDQYIVAGTSTSEKSGDKDVGTLGGSGKSDFWIVRIGPETIDSVPQTPDSVTKYKLAIAPNPVHDMLSFRYGSSDNANTPFALYSYDGKKVLSFTLMATEEVQTYTVPVGHLAKGVYYLTMFGKTGKMTKMVIRQ